MEIELEEEKAKTNRMAAELVQLTTERDALKKTLHDSRQKQKQAETSKAEMEIQFEELKEEYQRSIQKEENLVRLSLIPKIEFFRWTKSKT